MQADRIPCLAEHAAPGTGPFLSAQSLHSHEHLRVSMFNVIVVLSLPLQSILPFWKVYQANAMILATLATSRNRPLR